MSRRHNLRLLKRHASYTAVELADVLNVNIVTVRRWCGEGLQPIARRRPFLFLGSDVADWLAARHAPRVRLAPGQLYCVACRAPRIPRDYLVEREPLSATSINFVGSCPVSGHRMRRSVRISEIADKLGVCTLACEGDAMTMVQDREPHQMSLFEGVPA